MYVIEIAMRYKGEIHVAIVSPEDADLALLNWNVNNCPNRVGGKPKLYAARYFKGKRRYLHREVLARKLGREVRKDRVVDHGPDTDGLNCTRENLSECAQATNVRRMHKLRRMNLETCEVES